VEQSARKAQWVSGAAYEPYVGRWSRRVARAFLAWLAVPRGARWLDVGCGTGAVTQTILAEADPRSVHGVDASPDFIADAREQTPDERADFAVGDAQALADASATYDAAVSGLALNFMPHPEQALAEMVRVTRPRGIVAVYVWDYAGQMQLMRYFWDAAVALDPTAQDEGPRFPLCQPGPLEALWRAAQLQAVEARAIDVPTLFRDFDDYWTPFLGGQGPAPRYVMSLSEEHRASLREYLRAHLPSDPDGRIPLVARAWAVRGTVP
jgi:SAM-dependent methyltransferase